MVKITNEFEEAGESTYHVGFHTEDIYSNPSKEYKVNISEMEVAILKYLMNPNLQPGTFS